MSASFNISYQKDVDLSALMQDKFILAAIGFSSKAKTLTKSPPIFNVGIPNLDNKNIVEVWRSKKRVQYGTKDGIHYSQDGQVLFGYILLNEDRFTNLRQASAEIYKKILNFLQHSDYPYLFRIWNYFSAINHQQEKLERYRRFCLGRQDALNLYDNFAYSPPAATAIGTLSSGFQIYFIAAKTPGTQLENPRQTSAFLYPVQYSPVSPSFSRATVKYWGNKVQLYISGTASILGHETQHVGQLLLQLKETLNNVEALIEHGYNTLHLPLKTLQELALLKLYVRHKQDLGEIKKYLHQRYGKNLPKILYLKGDICRADLLIEIEGLYA